MVKRKYGNIKVVVDGHVFDSKAEATYYKELKAKQKVGMVTTIELQPRFILQDGFKKNGKTWRAITYIADFQVTYSDGHVEVVDVKGVETETFRIKHKMFERAYNNLHLVLIKNGKVSN